MVHLTILIPINKLPYLNDAFTTQCKNICESLSKKIDLKVTWVMFPSIPPYQKSDFVSSNHEVIFFDEFCNLSNIFDIVKPHIILVNGSLDFHNVQTILISRFRKIPIITLFFRNPYVEKLSFFSALQARFRGLTAKYDLSSKQPKLSRLFTIKFYFNQFNFLFKTLCNVEMTKIQSFMFFLKYVKITSLDVNPTHKIISGDVNLCNVEEMKNILLLHKFENSSIFVVGDPYFDNHDLREQKNITKNESLKPKILFCTTPNHEHGLCSKEKEFDLIINVINTILNHDIEIALKIHPTSSRIHEYTDALKGKILIPITIFQSENLTEILNDYDIMLTYGATGAIHDAVLIGKPIVNLDFDRNLTGFVAHYDEKIITHCKNIQSLISDIKNSNKKIILQNDIERFFQKYLGYSKIKPSITSADIIYSLFKKTFSSNKNNQN